METDLIVFDMAGTTVLDRGEVQNCFLKAAADSGIETSADRILSMMGWSKRLVFETLLTEQLGADHPELGSRIDSAYAKFRVILEHHYQHQAVEPSPGCLECFSTLRSQGILVGLTTGFYRKVTDIILTRLGWMAGLDDSRVGNRNSTIQVSVTSDEVPNGRPAPDMIFRAMRLTGVSDCRRVIKVGDTPSDLEAGTNAGCGWTIGVTNGTHSREQLETTPHDDLIGSLSDLPKLIGI